MLRGTVSPLVSLDRLTYSVDGQAEREIAVEPAEGDVGAFDAIVTGIAPGQHEIVLHARDRDGEAHVAPTITVEVVPTIRELTIPDEAGNAFPTAINERGDVTGYWTAIETPTWHAFVHRDGTTEKMVEHDWRSVATDINEHRRVVGYVHWLADPDVERAVSWDGTTVTPLFAQPGIAASINDAGIVSGGIIAAAGPPRGFVLAGSQLTTFGEPGRWTVGADVNAAGHVAGSSQSTVGDMFGFVITGAGTRVLGSLGGQRTSVAAISDGGTVVGYSEVADRSTYRAYRDDAAGMRELRAADLHDVASYANDVNARGVIVGEMITADGEHWAVIATDDELVAIEELIPEAPPLIAAFGISDRGEIAAVAVSGTGWLRPVIIAIPGGPEGALVPASTARVSTSRAARSRAGIADEAIADAVKAHRERSSRLERRAGARDPIQ